MDGRGRLAQPLSAACKHRVAGLRLPAAGVVEPFAAPASTLPLAHRARAALHRHSPASSRFSRGAAYGVVKGDHVTTISGRHQGRGATPPPMPPACASRRCRCSGQRQISREEIFAAAGVTERFLAAVPRCRATRAPGLRAIPWIAEATVRKLYPDRLQITISEREAFALWQKEGKVPVIAADGTVLEPLWSRRVSPRCRWWSARRGAEGARFPRGARPLSGDPRLVRATILVGERRWNLRLKNGIDVRLPETDVEHALERWPRSTRKRTCCRATSSRSICGFPTASRCGCPTRLAQARDDALKDKKTKKKGGDA